jgi:transcriptional regulator with XRE-family HTH domain
MNEHDPQPLGASLRLAREQSGLTLRQIADATKLSVRALEALERDQVNQLPGGIYRRAIVRSYASQVGLDPEKTLREFLGVYPDDVPSMASLQPPPVPERPSGRAFHTIVSLLGALIPILAGVFYFTLSARGADAPRHIIDVMPPRTAGVSAQIIPAALSTTINDSVSMMISVSARTYLQVVADGREVLARHLTAGEVVRLDLADDVLLTGDNAGAVHFSINGRAGRTLGDAGSPLAARIMRDDYVDWLIQP